MFRPKGHLRVRTQGAAGPPVVVLHGGPGAAGNAAPIARELAGTFRVLEPWQRGSEGGEPLSVERHVADLRDLLEGRCETRRPALVGESWGAMLALAFAAAHPHMAGPLVLVGCGTFDPEARVQLRATLEERTDEALRRRLRRLEEAIPDVDERLRETYRLTKPLYDYDPIPLAEDAAPALDVRAHRETWDDMVRLQDEGVYPEAFGAITSPVLMLHGAYDPHPGALIRASLEPFIPNLEYREWQRCGHSPWLERTVRDEFFDVLRAWLLERS